MALRINISRDLAALRKLAAAVQRAAPELLKAEMPRVIVAFQNVTPPATGSVKLGAAIARGRARVRGDVWRVARPARAGEAVGNLDAAMRQHRVKGRVVGRVNPRVPVPMSDMLEYIATGQSRVGTLARAWTAVVEITGDGARLKLRNATPYADAVEGLAERVKLVQKREQRRIERKAQSLVMAEAVRAGLRVRR